MVRVVWWLGGGCLRGASVVGALVGPRQELMCFVKYI